MVSPYRCRLSYIVAVYRFIVFELSKYFRYNIIASLSNGDIETSYAISNTWFIYTAILNEKGKASRQTSATTELQLRPQAQRLCLRLFLLGVLTLNTVKTISSANQNEFYMMIFLGQISPIGSVIAPLMIDGLRSGAREQARKGRKGLRSLLCVYARTVIV